MTIQIKNKVYSWSSYTELEKVFKLSNMRLPQFTSFGDNVVIGDNILFSSGITIGNNVIIEDSSFIGNGVMIGNNVVIGKFSSMEEDVVIKRHAKLKPYAHVYKGRIVGAGDIL